MRASAEGRILARRYARALLQVLLDKNGDPDGVDRDLGEVVDVLEREPQLAAILSSPTIPSERRAALVDKLAEIIETGGYTRNLLKLLAAKERISLVPAVREQYRSVLDEHRRIASAEVITATSSLSEEQKKRLSRELSEITGKTMRLEFRTDAEILGGLVIRIGNRIYDASVVKQLQRIKDRALSTA